MVKHRKPWSRFLAVAGVGALAVLALVLLPGGALADDPDDDPEEETEDQPYGDAWRLGEIYFVPPDPVPGRRVFIEGHQRNRQPRQRHPPGGPRVAPAGRAYGGRSGRTLRMGFNTP